MLWRPLVLACVLASAALSTSEALAAPIVHAHRGGALDLGRPVLPEDTMPAFRAAADSPGTWLELDTLVTKDGVPVVIHDSTLDRTTDCTGNVVDKTVAEIEGCRVDRLGVSDTLVEAPAAPVVRIPRLTEVLAFARQRGVPVNLEIKRIPGDPGYVPGDTGFATKVMDVVKAAALDPAKLIVQSFDFTNLDVAKAALPGVQLSFLTLAQANEGAPEIAASRGYQWVSPGGVPSKAFVERAHGRGLKVVPYTLNTPEEVLAAAAAGVEAVITDDIPMARAALGLGSIAPPVMASPPSSSPRLTLSSRSLRVVRRQGGLAARLSGPAAARAVVTVRLGRVVVARGTIVLRAAGRRSALIRLTPAGRRVLRKRRTARLDATIVLDRRRPIRETVTLR